jgi:hypothetical protein
MPAQMLCAEESSDGMSATQSKCSGAVVDVINFAICLLRLRRLCMLKGKRKCCKASQKAIHTRSNFRLCNPLEIYFCIRQIMITCCYSFVLF